MKLVFAITLGILIAGLSACGGAAFFLANAPTAFGSFTRMADVAYGEDKQQRLDVYRPKGAVLPPVVIFFHGGSWATGSRSQYRFVGAALASRGFVTAVVDYRLYPQVRFPAFMEDGARAVAWMRQHAAQFGGDPQMLVLMGHSAGAHMAALLALDSSYLTKAGVPAGSIAALVGLSGPYALDPNTDELRTIFSQPYTPENWQPVRFVSNQAPPSLLLQGLADKVVAASHTQKLRDALVAQGIPVETHLYPKAGHADTIAPFTLIARNRTTAFEQTLTFLQHLSARSDPSR